MGGFTTVGTIIRLFVNFDRLRASFEVTKDAVRLADGRSQEHTPHFGILTGFIRQIDISLQSMAEFFRGDDNTAGNFRTRFGPYAGYLDVITSAAEGIGALKRIYSGLVDADKLAELYCGKRT